MLQLASRQCCGAVAARVAAALLQQALRRCFSSHRGNVAALLQQALRRCFSSHRGNVAALLLRRCCSSQQRRKATHYATMASGSSARGNDKQGYAALQ
jgi:hypothetical protein